MKKIILGYFILLFVVVVLTANSNAEQRRARRELPSLPPNTTEVRTKHNDIAHFSCTTRLLATISWKKETKDINNEELGLEILSYNVSGAAPFFKSHLLVAVTDDDLRGKYECFSSDDPGVAMKTFFIKNDSESRDKRLPYEKILAIILSLSIAFFIVIFITFYLWRGHRQIKREAMRARGRRNHEGAQENFAVQEEIVLTSLNPVERKETGNGVVNDHDTETGLVDLDAMDAQP
ncbi:uncharacterized protein [Montipora foliosa]|uniref:uncharacterized protein n=1 Tax=Montipora foliosa TaxID=591990 RepID=UPI0035F1E4EF